MTSTPRPLIDSLGLKAHPEGGWYRRIFASRTLGEGDRPVMTSILYALCRGEYSRWHVVDADEAWHFHEGAPITLHVYDAESRQLDVVTLGASSQGYEPAWVVPAGRWQAATVSGEFGMVGCTVAPGFQFAGFQLVTDLPGHEDHFVAALSEHRRLLRP